MGENVEKLVSGSILKTNGLYMIKVPKPSRYNENVIPLCLSALVPGLTHVEKHEILTCNFL